MRSLRVLGFLLMLACQTSLYAEEAGTYYLINDNSINLGAITQAELDLYMESTFILVGKTTTEQKPSRYNVVRYRDIEKYITYETHLIFETKNESSYNLAIQKSNSSAELKATFTSELDTKNKNQQEILTELELKHPENKRIKELVKSVRATKGNPFVFKQIWQSPDVYIFKLGSYLSVLKNGSFIFDIQLSDSYPSAGYRHLLRINGILYLHGTSYSMGPDTQPLLIRIDDESKEKPKLELKSFDGEYGHRGC
jgi:hypothetical protein